MKIARLATYHAAPRWLFLKIETDEGISGWGEPVVEGRARAVEAAVHELAGYLVGQDPARINDLRQAAIDFTTPPVRVDVREYAARRDDASEATLLVLRVEVGERVHLLTDGTCYLRVGDELNFRFTLPGKRNVVGRGRVARETAPTNFGVEFVTLEGDGRDAVLDFLRAVPPD